MVSNGSWRRRLAVTATATAAAAATAMAQRQVPGPPRHGEADPNKADKVTMTGRNPQLFPGWNLELWRLSDGGQCGTAMILVQVQRRRMHEVPHLDALCFCLLGGHWWSPS